jgi:hypothetical protein
VPQKPLPFEILHEESTIRFLGSVYATARIATAVRRLLPRVLHLLSRLPPLFIVFFLELFIFFPEEFIFIISYDMTLEIGQGSRSSKHLGGYELFIFSLFYAF